MLENKTEQPKKIIPGYISIFDSISLKKSESENNSLKEKFALATKKVSEAWTLKDLYNATSLAVELPATNSEAEIKNNLLKLWKALDNIDYKDMRPEVNTAFIFIDNQVMMRYTTICSGK